MNLESLISTALAEGRNGSCNLSFLLLMPLTRESSNLRASHFCDSSKRRSPRSGIFAELDLASKIFSAGNKKSLSLAQEIFGRFGFEPYTIDCCYP